MKTRILWPKFMHPASEWRLVVKNNAGIKKVIFTIATDELWMPRVLVDTGFFPSTSEIKRNRSDLWRNLEKFDSCDLSWADIEIIPLEFADTWQLPDMVVELHEWFINQERIRLFIEEPEQVK